MDLDDEQLLIDAKETDKKLDDIIQECGAEPYVGDNLLAFKENKLKNSVLKKSRNTLLNGSLSKSQKILKTGTFSEYGSGITAYFHFLTTLMKIYLGMCVFVFPIMYLY